MSKLTKYQVRWSWRDMGIPDEEQDHHVGMSKWIVGLNDGDGYLKACWIYDQMNRQIDDLCDTGIELYNLRIVRSVEEEVSR